MFTLSVIQIFGQETLGITSNLRIACLEQLVQQTNNDKEKYVHCGLGITFDSAGLWSFDNDTARNAIIFGVDHLKLTIARKFFWCQEKVQLLAFFGSPEKKFTL